MRLRGYSGESAFSLVEVTLALGIAAFCLLAVFGLLPIALKIQSTSVGQTGASSVTSSIEGDLRATPSGVTTSSQYAIPIGTTTTMYFSALGQKSAAVTPQSAYRATVTFEPNPGGASSATLAMVTVSWPAAATVADSIGNRSSFFAIDRN